MAVHGIEHLLYGGVEQEVGVQLVLRAHLTPTQYSNRSGECSGHQLREEDGQHPGGEDGHRQAAPPVRQHRPVDLCTVRVSTTWPQPCIPRTVIRIFTSFSRISVRSGSTCQKCLYYSILTLLFNPTAIHFQILNLLFLMHHLVDDYAALQLV